MTDFALHPRLAADTLPVGDMPLSRVLLMGDARFPWLILVPRRPGLIEFTDLDAGERGMLMEEIAAASRALQGRDRRRKMNVGALGNVVAQLHVHVVARSSSDVAGPARCGAAARPSPTPNVRQRRWPSGSPLPSASVEAGQPVESRAP